jgi:hypothetical protein
MTTSNWVENSGAHPSHAHEYITLYYVSDIMLVAMFSRIYFLVQSLVCRSPTMSLQGKRLCTDRNFEPSLSFHIRACLIKYPTYSFITMQTVAVTFFSFALRIFERPYYHYNMEPS